MLYIYIMPDFSNLTSIIILAVIAALVLSLLVITCVLLAKKKHIKSGADVFVRVYSSITLVLFFLLAFCEVLIWLPKFIANSPIYIDVVSAEVALGSFKFSLFSSSVWTAVDNIASAIVIAAGLVLSVVVLIVDCCKVRKETALEASLREAASGETNDKPKKEKVKKEKVKKEKVKKDDGQDKAAAPQNIENEFNNAYADLTASLSSESLGKVGLWNLDEEKPEAASANRTANDAFSVVGEDNGDEFGQDIPQSDSTQADDVTDTEEEIKITEENHDPEDVQKYMAPRTSEISSEGTKVIEELELNPIKSTEIVVETPVNIDDVVTLDSLNSSFVTDTQSIEDSFGNDDEFDVAESTLDNEEQAEEYDEVDDSEEQAEEYDKVDDSEEQTEEYDEVNDSEEQAEEYDEVDDSEEQTEEYDEVDEVEEQTEEYDEVDEEPADEEYIKEPTDIYIKEPTARESVQTDVSARDSKSAEAAQEREDIPEKESAELYDKINEFLNKFVKEGPRVVVVNNNTKAKADAVAPIKAASKAKSAKQTKAKSAKAKTGKKAEQKSKTAKKTKVQAKPEPIEEKRVEPEVIHVQAERVAPQDGAKSTPISRPAQKQSERVKTVKAERIDEKQKSDKQKPHVKTNLPLTRRYVILDRTSAANVFGEYLKEKEKSDKVIPLK